LNGLLPITVSTVAEASAARSLRYTRRGVATGFTEAIPLALSVLPWGVAFGVAALAVISPLQALVMSAYLYSGTAQFVALGMWHQPLAISSMLLAVFAVNARYLLQGVTLAPWLHALPAWQRWGTLFFMADANWAASLRRFDNGYDDVGYLLGSGLAMYLAWLMSTGLGLLLPMQSMDAKKLGLDFAISAALVALAGARWAGRSSLLPWCVAAVAAAVSWRLLGGTWFMFIGGIAGAVAGAYRDEQRNNS
jgi:predicted branched-subunit amino acid permease